jgi:hypothetical protein
VTDDPWQKLAQIDALDPLGSLKNQRARIGVNWTPRIEAAKSSSRFTLHGCGVFHSINKAV